MGKCDSVPRTLVPFSTELKGSQTQKHRDCRSLPDLWCVVFL